MVSIGILLCVGMAGIFAGQVAPYDPVAIDSSLQLAAPSREHLFGTDAFGRDIFSRIIFGAKTALTIGVLASLFGCSIGAVLGMTSAYAGGVFDLLVQRVIDMLLCFPTIMMALVVVAILGKNQVHGLDLNLVYAIAIL